MNKRANKLLSKAERRQHDRAILENTARCRAEPFFDPNGTMRALGCDTSEHLLTHIEHTQTDNRPYNSRLYKPKKCYICKAHFVDVHHFYHRLCPDCAAQNYAYRQQSTDLTGRVALVTGGRIKIGFEIALKLLRAGATVLVTTRFAQDALHRYHQQPDFEQWQQRLQIYSLDLKHIDSVEAFTNYLQTHLPALDILINNAAQTLRKPESYYQHMAKQEQRRRSQLQALQNLLGQFSGKQLLYTLQQRLSHADHADEADEADESVRGSNRSDTIPVGD